MGATAGGLFDAMAFAGSGGGAVEGVGAGAGASGGAGAAFRAGGGAPTGGRSVSVFCGIASPIEPKSCVSARLRIGL